MGMRDALRPKPRQVFVGPDHHRAVDESIAWTVDQPDEIVKRLSPHEIDHDLGMAAGTDDQELRPRLSVPHRVSPP